MALNFSHRPVFTSHLSEENLVSPITVANREVESSGSQERDILDLLPADPFGWIEDLEVDYGGFRIDEADVRTGDYQLFAGLNFIRLNALMFQAFPEKITVGGTSNASDGPSGFNGEKQVRDVSDCSCYVGDQAEETNSVSTSCSLDDGEVPHFALSFALFHLGLRDLMAAERVCSSLCLTVRSDPLLWRIIHIDQPLNEKITDDILLQLCSRAQATMQCLSLVECPKITDDCLRQVLDRNPRLTKLIVSGCAKIGIDAIVKSLKTFKSTGTQGIKHLRVGELYGVTHEHFKELMLLLGTNSQMQLNTHRPRYFHRKHLHLSCDDDDRMIDIEMCPRCQNVRLLYDCPAEGCQRKERGDEICRACALCILRCVQCGHCINGSDYEETFSLESLCLKCKETSTVKAGLSG